ncbi:hypothetical protein, partial [Klebsiella pneumoniae]|uniref:hypothetical protein n=1 Tax=Klebsiella pneumoniae TaxID=573 RepID=UPI003F7A8810
DIFRIKVQRVGGKGRALFRAGQPGRPGADNRHPLAARLNLRKVRTPAAGQRLVGNIALNIAEAFVRLDRAVARLTR